ncbi:MAG: hypothetical protein ACKOB5_15260 [Betaproteobacteria bacterium]
MHTLLAAALKAVEALEESIEYTQVPGWSPSVERRKQALHALQTAIREGLEPSAYRAMLLTAPRWDTARASELGPHAIPPSRRSTFNAGTASPGRRVMVRR